MASARSGSRRSTVREVRRHRAPAWFLDAKLGIFVHWTPASVPGFAPVDVDMGDLIASGDPTALSRSPYAEWYENSLRFPDSPVAVHHREAWRGRDYHDFGGDFADGAADWDPDDWARTFAATGARYVVLVAKHSDGYCLWPSSVPNPHLPSFRSPRDLVGELGEAVRGQGMRFGLYYCGGFDWTFDQHPIGSYGDVALAQPGGAYPAYAEAQVRELIERYRPAVLWNDVSWPASTAELAGLLDDYYRAVPDGVVNDRFTPRSALFSIARTPPGRALVDRAMAKAAAADGGIVPPRPPLFDYRTPEYTTFTEVQPTPWECTRGMDHSFAYNRMSAEEHFVSRDDLLGSFADVVATGGNLLLNVGPRGEDARIPDEQLRRLAWLGELTSAGPDAVFGTRPWVVPAETTPEGRRVRYTARDRTTFALLPDATGATGAAGPCTLPSVLPSPTTRVTAADGTDLAWRDSPVGLVVELGANPGGAGSPITLALHDVHGRTTGG